MQAQLIGFPSPRSSFAGRGITVIDGLRRRRSRAGFDAEAPIAFNAVARILNESAGLTREFGRGTPSPGRAYPIECYAAVSRVERVAPGLYRYDPVKHGLWALGSGGTPRPWLETVLANTLIARTESMHVFFVACLEQGRAKFGPHADRFLLLEAGHLAQSMLLLAENEGLGGCAIGRFDRAGVDAAFAFTADDRTVVHSAAFGGIDPADSAPALS